MGAGQRDLVGDLGVEKVVAVRHGRAGRLGSADRPERNESVRDAPRDLLEGLLRVNQVAVADLPAPHPFARGRGGVGVQAAVLALGPVRAARVVTPALHDLQIVNPEPTSRKRRRTAGPGHGDRLVDEILRLADSHLEIRERARPRHRDRRVERRPGRGSGEGQRRAGQDTDHRGAEHHRQQRCHPTAHTHPCPPQLHIAGATSGGPGTRASRSTTASIANLVPVMPDHWGPKGNCGAAPWTN
jgi:hypothetical protein